MVFFGNIIEWIKNEGYFIYFILVFDFLRVYEFYIKLVNFELFVFKVFFLGYMVLRDGIFMEFSKVVVIKLLDNFKFISNVKSFYGLVFFYKRFISNFRFLVVFIKNCVKRGVFYCFKLFMEFLNFLFVYVLVIFKFK